MGEGAWPVQVSARGRPAWDRVAGVELRLQRGDPLGERVGLPRTIGLRPRAIGLRLRALGLFSGQPATLPGFVVREAQPRAVVGHHQPRAELVGVRRRGRPRTPVETPRRPCAATPAAPTDPACPAPAPLRVEHPQLARAARGVLRRAFEVVLVGRVAAAPPRRPRAAPCARAPTCAGCAASRLAASDRRGTRPGRRPRRGAPRPSAARGWRTPLRRAPSGRSTRGGSSPAARRSVDVRWSRAWSRRPRAPTARTTTGP